MIIQNAKACERLQESLDRLKMLEQSNKSLKAGKIKPVAKAFDDLRKRVNRFSLLQKNQSKII